jgi:NAD(P)-dependent dehydrogenase (short-subunit alcohol dehydrogenase family)
MCTFQVEENEGSIHLFQGDVTHATNCKDLVRNAVDVLGGLNILVDDAVYQMSKADIADMEE